MKLTEMHCDRCRRLTEFEQPECRDSHGADCPDWVCVMCGEAVFTGVMPTHADRAVAAPGDLRRSA